MLFNFGPQRDDAEQALAMIRRYGFDQLGFVGRGAPPMMYFLADPRRLASRQRPAGYFGIHAGYDKALKPDPEPGVKPPAREEKLLPSALPVTRQLASTAALLPDSPAAGERVPFDWRQVQVKQDHGQCRLAIGSYTIASFGRNDRLAREAERVVQHYRFTEHCRIGQPTPSFTFFLVSGQPPRGVLFGLNDLPFRPEALRVQQVAGFWAVCDGDRPILQFGDKADDARTAVQVIQRFHFDHLCRVGDSESGMSFLVRSR